MKISVVKSAGYAVITMRTAWFKHYHPQVFWTATLNSILGKADKQKAYIASAAKDGVSMLPPSVNKSDLIFTVNSEHEVRMGLQGLKQLGKSAIPIIEERKAHGDYKDIADLIRRVSPSKSAIESLVYSGALDDFGVSRAAIISHMDDILEFKNLLKKHNTWADTDEVDAWYNEQLTLQIPDAPEMRDKVKLNKEYEYTGMYVTGHPLDEYSEILNGLSHTDIEELIIDKDDDLDEEQTAELYAFKEERKVVIVGVLKDVEKRLTQKGDPMVTGRCEDKTGSIKVTVFPKSYESAQVSFVEDNTVIIEGTWKCDDYGQQVILDKVTPLNEAIASSTSKLFILLDMEDAQKIVDEICLNFGDKTNDGPVLIVRTPDKYTMYCDKDTGKLVPAKYDPNRDTRRDKHIKLNLYAFSVIKEVVKSISVRPEAKRPPTNW